MDVGDLVLLLAPCDVFFVGVHCSLEELEIDGTRDVEDNASEVIAAWRARQAPSAFRRMLKEERCASWLPCSSLSFRYRP